MEPPTGVGRYDDLHQHIANLATSPDIERVKLENIEQPDDVEEKDVQAYENEDPSANERESRMQAPQPQAPEAAPPEPQSQTKLQHEGYQPLHDHE